MHAGQSCCMQAACSTCNEPLPPAASPHNKLALSVKLADCRWWMQASLESERTHLRQRLKEALQLHMMPKVALSTTSPIDLTIQLLDELLEVCSVKHILWCAATATPTMTVSDCHAAPVGEMIMAEPACCT